ncbi:MAG TPA: hypothetical protein VFN94_03330 [Nitrospiria bacterium]|nr:hypothetical protein [Nitrospiria bacterium]
MTTRSKVLSLTAIALALIMAGGLWWLYHSLGPLVATTIRTFGPEITGVAVRIDDVTIEPFKGTAALHGLVVGNPKEFKADHALSLGEFSMTLKLRSLLGNVIVIKQIVIAKPEVTYEIGADGSNLAAIQRNVDRYVGSSGAVDRPAKEPTARSDNGGKKLVIQDLVIKDATAHVSAAFLQGKTLSVPLPDLHLENIGQESNGATAGEAVKQVFGAITKSVTVAVAALNLSGATESLQKGAGSVGGFIKGLLK